MPAPFKRYRLLLDDIVYTEPVNWVDFTPTTERHGVYKTLLTMYSEGSVKLIKDAKNYVDEIYATYGTAKTIDFKWQEYDYATESYEDIFAIGRLNLSEKYRRERDYTEVGMEPSGFVMNLLNNDEVLFDLQRLKDKDGGTITPFTNETIEVDIEGCVIEYLYEQKQELSNGNKDYAVSTFTNVYIVPQLDTLILDEITEKQDIDQQIDNSTPDAETALFIFEQTGKLDLDITIDVSAPAGISNINAWEYILLNANGVEKSALGFTGTVIYDGSGGGDAIVRYTLNIDNLQVNATDKLIIRGEYTGAGGNTVTILAQDSQTVYPSGTHDGISQFKLTFDTEFETTTTKGMLVWEYLLRMCQKITGRNDCLRSPIFGRTDGEVYTYGTDGEYSGYFITNGKLLRGFPDATLKDQLQLAFNELNALFNIGLGIVYESGTPYIYIDKLESFFDNTTLEFTVSSDYPSIEWTPANDYIFGSVNCGYNNYGDEEQGTLLSPHSTRTYTLPFISDFSNKSYEASNSWIASGQVWEIQRRKRFVNGNNEDSDFDELNFILNVERDGSDWVAVGGANFTTENLNTKASDYNLDITPARNIRRHSRMLLSALTKRINNTNFETFLRFQSGTANTDYQSFKTGDLSSPELFISISGAVGTFATGDTITFLTGATATILDDNPAIRDLKIVMTSGNYAQTLISSSSGGQAVAGESETENDLPEGADIQMKFLNSEQQEPLFDASEKGSCKVKLNKEQRQLLKEGIRGYVIVNEGENQYQGILESIKEVNLQESVAEITFLSTTAVPPSFLLLETGDFMLLETGGKIKLEGSA